MLILGNNNIIADISMVLDARQGELLTHIIEEYVATSEPVGSKLLAEKYSMNVSPATVRNDMSLLEEEGFISQPHISAGRIPTEKAYRYWIAQYEAVPLEKKEEQAYRRAWEIGEGDQSIKELAKFLSDEVENAVVVAFGPEDFFYTGLSALFNQPEFSEQCSTVSVARVVDHLDRILSDMVRKVKMQTVLLGRENPFGKMCGFIGAPYQYKSRQGCVGILGPLRMHYPKNIRRITLVADLIQLAK